MTDKPAIRFSPAECSIECTDPQCPYTHVAGWFCGDDGPYETREAAEQSAFEPDGDDYADRAEWKARL